MWKTLARKLLPNPLDTILHKAKETGAQTFLIGWNRGMGDIALGLYPLVVKIQEKIPQANVTFITRKDLYPAFALFPEVSCRIDPTLQRGKSYDITQSKVVNVKDYDVVINWPDPTHWCQSMLGRFVPKLTWQTNWNQAHERFSLDPSKNYVGLQPSISSEHGEWRDWGVENFMELIERLEKDHGRTVILFGSADEGYPINRGIDLRGKTTLPELFSLIKAFCKEVILPDSGILSILYYLNTPFSVHIVSLWAQPLQGVLKQNVPSPNPDLQHTPIIGGYKDTTSISVDQVIAALTKNVYAGV